jgi:DNA-binding transcriptional MerR regulator
MPSDPELLPLAAAAKLVGKSVDTLRRWKRDGLLAFEGPDAQGRALVNRSALLLAAQGHARDTAPTRVQRPSGAPPLPTSIVASAVQGELEAVRAHLAEVRAERDELKAHRARLQSDVDELRRLLDDSRLRVSSLEKELNRGVRGLLKRTFMG